jgi:uncharacterized protein YjeT (DUF2065 family)
MNSTRLAGIVLMVVGVLGLLYGTFSFTKDRHTAHLGALEMSVSDRETVNIPRWVGIGALAAGAVLLFVPRRKG